MCANVQAKQATLTILAQICSKTNLGLEIQKTNVGIRISIFKNIMCANFQEKQETLIILTQGWILESVFQKSKSGFRRAPSTYHVCQFSVKIHNFKFLD